MKRCVYEGNADEPCPISEDWSCDLLQRTCKEDAYGGNCAAILGQQLVADTVDLETFESTIDNALGLINGELWFPQTPNGLAPESIREPVGQAILPLREKRPELEGSVLVHHQDLYLTLLNMELLKEANWYQARYEELRIECPDFEWWSFDEADGVVNEFIRPAIGSIEQYDQSSDINSAAMANTYLPPLLAIREAKRNSEARPILELL